MNDDSRSEPPDPDDGKRADNHHEIEPAAPSEPPARPPARPAVHQRFADAAERSDATVPLGPDDAAESLIDYGRMIQRALRTVVHDALLQVSLEGLPGDHHFFIDFATNAAGTHVPEALRREFPELMRIVLQRQFWNLTVDDDGFEVDLRFGGRGTHLRVPFSAVAAFVDPAAHLALRFDAVTAEEPVDEASEAEEAVAREDDRPRGDADVVSIEAFRKRDK